MPNTRTQIKALEAMPSAVPLEVDGQPVPAIHLVLTDALAEDLLGHLGEQLDGHPRCPGYRRPSLGTIRDTLSAARLGRRLARGVVEA